MSKLGIELPQDSPPAVASPWMHSLAAPSANTLHSPPSPSPSSASLSPSSSSMQQPTVSMTEIAIVGRAADPFNKEIWDDDFDFPLSSKLIDRVDEKAHLRQPHSSHTHRHGHSSNDKRASSMHHSGSGNDNDDDEDWDAEIEAEIEANNAAVRESQRFVINKPDTAAITNTSTNNDDDDDEDWDAEIAAEAKAANIRHSSGLLKPPSDDAEDWSDIDDIRSTTLMSPSSKHSHSHSLDANTASTVSDKPLKSMLYQMLGIDGNDDSEESQDTGLPPSKNILSLINAPKANDQRINILTYPAPSSLYSLSTEDGRRELTEKQLEAWLRDCVSKHTNGTMRTSTVNHAQSVAATTTANSNNKTSSKSKDKRVRRVFDDRMLMIPGSVTSSPPTLNKAASLSSQSNHSPSPSFSASSANHSDHHLSQSSPLAAILPDLLLYLSYIYHTHSSHNAHANNAFVNEGWNLTAKLFGFIEARQHLAGVREFLDHELSYQHCHCVLMIAAKWWTPARAKQFSSFIAAAQSLFPSYQGHLELLEWETLAHHDGSRANIIIRTFVSIYRRHSMVIASAASPSPHSYECAAQALTALNFYLTSCSPLNTAPLSELAQWDAEKEEFAWLDLAWSGESPSDNGNENGTTSEIESLTWQLCGSPPYRISLISTLYTHLRPFTHIKARCAYILGHFALVHGEEAGAEVLEGHRPSVDTHTPSNNSTAPHANSEHHVKLAEKFLFECVYILDHIPIMPCLLATPTSPIVSPIHSPRYIDTNAGGRQSLPISFPQCEPYIDPSLGPPIVPLLSELGTTSLMLYGDCLLSLSKYQYAILCYESASVSYRYRKHAEFHALNKKLCEICTKYEDLDRSVKYHQKIAEQAMSEGNLNMYVYIVQELSRLHALQGQAVKSEENLRQALKFLKQFMGKGGGGSHGHATLQPHTLSHLANHHQHSASSMMGGGHTGMRVTVSTAATIDVAHSKFLSIAPSEFRSATLNIYLQLARLYLDSDRIHNACLLLEALIHTELPRSKAGVVNLLLAQTYMKRRRYKKAERILKFMEGASSGSSASTVTPGLVKPKGVGLSLAGSDILNSLDYLIVRTKTYYHSGDYASALYWIDVALTTCSSSSLGMLARLHYRKGKIYQAALLASMLPPTLASTQTDYYPPPLAPPIVLHRCILPDPRKAVTSLYDAYHYYEAIDDHARQMKCLQRIADIYTHIAFTPIAMIGVSSTDLLPWLQLADFDVSDTDTAFQSFIGQIEELTSQTLDSAVVSLKVMDALPAYLTMAEIRLMQGSTEASQSYWQAAKDAFFTLFVASSQLLVTRKSTPGFVRKVSMILKRLVRLAVLMKGKWINQRLEVLDAWVLYEQEMTVDLKRAAELDDEEERSQSCATTNTNDNKRGNDSKDVSGLKRPTSNNSNASLNVNVMPDLSLVLEPLSPLIDEAPNTPLSPVSPNSRKAALLVSRPTWSDHRSAAWGALGSRSKHSPTNTHTGVSVHAASSVHHTVTPLTLSRYAADSPMAVRIASLSDKACQSLHEITRHNEQHAAGKLSAKQLHDANLTTLARICELTESVRVILAMNEEEENRTTDTATNSDASPSAPSLQPSRSAQLTNQLHSRLTRWLPSSHTLSDPLFPQLLYAFVLDSVFVMYSPKLHHRLIRLIAHSTPAPSPSPSASPELTGMRPPPLPSPTNGNAPAPLLSTNSRSSLFSFALSSAPFVDRLMKDFNASKPSARPRTRPRSPDTITVELKAVAEEDKAPTVTTANTTSVSKVKQSSLSQSDNLALSLPTRTASIGSVSADQCHVCNCSWYTAHPFSGSVCRNCFHDHRGWLTEELQPVVANTDAIIDVNDIIATVDDDSVGDSDDGDENDNGAVHDSRSTPALPPSHYQAQARLPAASVSSVNHSAVAMSPRHAKPSLPPVLHTHPYDIDSLLPPSLDLPLFQELLAALDPQHVLTLLAALFGECQIILTSNSLYRIKAVINSITRLMYPFVWQHLLVPLLPRSSIDLLACHSPYIIGVHQSIYDGLSFHHLSHSPVIVELDKNTIKFNAGSFMHLPVKAKNKLYKCIVKFQSAMFLMQATSGGGGGGAVTLPQSSPSASPSLSMSSMSFSQSSLSSPSSASRKRPVLALRSLRDGFLSVFLSMLHTYPLYLTPSLQSSLAMTENEAQFNSHQFLANVPLHYAAFLHALVRTKLFKHFIALRCGSYMCSLRASIRQSLREKLLVSWKEMLSADTSSGSSTNGSESRSFSLSVFAAPSSSYLFDHLTMHKLHSKKLKWQARLHCNHAEPVVMQRGTKGFKKRYLVLEGSRLMIYAARKNYESKKEKPKYVRELVSGVYRLVQPAIDNHEHKFAFEIVNVEAESRSLTAADADDSALKANDKTKDKERLKALELAAERAEPWQIRCESDDARKKWVKLIGARLLTDERKQQWEQAV